LNFNYFITGTLFHVLGYWTSTLVATLHRPSLSLFLLRSMPSRVNLNRIGLFPAVTLLRFGRTYPARAFSDAFSALREIMIGYKNPCAVTTKKSKSSEPRPALHIIQVVGERWRFKTSLLTQPSLISKASSTVRILLPCTVQYILFSTSHP
jgi:hypothetical protein